MSESQGFIRLPNDGERCPFSGYSRATLLELICDGLIESRWLAGPSGRQGLTVIPRKSLEDFINSLPPRPVKQGRKIKRTKTKKHERNERLNHRSTRPDAIAQTAGYRRTVPCESLRPYRIA
jgi:hypothetical protein